MFVAILAIGSSIGIKIKLCCFLNSSQNLIARLLFLVPRAMAEDISGRIISGNKIVSESFILSKKFLLVYEISQMTKNYLLSH